MKTISDLPASAKYTVLTQPIWSIFGKNVLFFAPLYMKGIGLSEIQIGLIGSINLFFTFIFHMFSSTINNRLGRKKTIFIFDFLCWSVPMLIWGIAQNFWYFLIASIFNATVKISTIAWYCLLAEDVRADQRSKIFGVVTVINTLPGLITPIFGLIIMHYGIVPTLRVVYFLAAISMTAGFIIRNKYTTETKAGLELIRLHNRISLVGSFKEYINTILRAYQNRKFLLAAFTFITTNFIVSMNFLQVVFIKEYLGFKDGAVSFTQVIVAIVNLFLFIFVMPKIKLSAEKRALLVSLLICAVGFIMLMLIPKGNVIALFLVITIIAVGNYATTTHRDAVFMNELGGNEKAEMLSAVQIVTAFACIPSGYLTGYLYTVSPLLPFAVIAGLYMTTAIVPAVTGPK